MNLNDPKERFFDAKLRRIEGVGALIAAKGGGTTTGGEMAGGGGTTTVRAAGGDTEAVSEAGASGAPRDSSWSIRS
jgi:hypothetical protein